MKLFMSFNYFILKISIIILLGGFDIADAFAENGTTIRQLDIRQETLSHNGVMMSRPIQIDQKISDIIYLNKISNLEDYSRWLQENFQYKQDAQFDMWAEPLETLNKKYGDCEDYAFLTSAFLRVLGYTPQFIALIRFTKTGQKAHAICVFKINGYYAWFDNDKFIKTQASTIQEFAQYMTTSYSYHQLQELNEQTKIWYTIYDKSKAA